TEVREIKFIAMSFATKLMAFMNPMIAAVYDDVISKRLSTQVDPSLSTLHVPTLATSTKERALQAIAYEGWCRWCRDKAVELNSAQKKWRDWDASTHAWRALDVERAFFALGREA